MESRYALAPNGTVNPEVIVSGDFFQLAPIPQKGYEKPCYAFRATCWDVLFPSGQTCVLTKVFRQREKGLRDLLENVKRGHCTEKDKKLLRNLERKVRYETGTEPVEL